MKQTQTAKAPASRRDWPVVQIPLGWVSIDCWAPTTMLCEASLTIDGAALVLSAGMKWRRDKWTVDFWTVEPLDFDRDLYNVRDAEGKITAIDFEKLNEDVQRQIPGKAKNIAYREMVTTVRSWTASHPTEMREMQRRAMRCQSRIIRRDFQENLERLREEVIEEVRSRFLWTKRHGDLDSSELGAREYGRLLRTLESAARQLEQVTSRIPATLGHRLAAA